MPTQEVTAPGSTFKLVTATAGVMENKISIYDTITCTGKFDLVEKDNPINCWIIPQRTAGIPWTGNAGDSHP